MSLPPVHDAFYWTDETWGPALRCRPLEAVAPHLFSTRHLDMARPDHVRQLTTALHADGVLMLTQVHGNGVTVVTDDEHVPPSSGEGDVLVSRAVRHAVGVKAADCVPLLMADPVSGGVAAVHAGWRGTVARAAVAAVQTLSAQFNAAPRNLVVAIGPSIGACCYEVGPELVDAFAAAGHERYLIDRWFLAPPPRRGFRERPPMHLDVAGANRDQLILAGVPEEQIHIAGLCTAMHLDILTSYRAEKADAGRLVAVIRSRALS